MKYAVENGIIDLEHVQEEIEMKEREKILEEHPYKIWQGKDGEWHTYLPDEEKGRVQRHRRTEKEIQNLIVKYWKEQRENPTIKELYEEWSTKKLERKEIVISTKNRYDRQFKESMTEFGKLKIKSVQPCDIEDFILDAIHEHQLTVKGYSNLRTLIYGIFKRAKSKRLVSFSITEIIKDMEISPKSFRRIHHEDDELVFMEDEHQKILSYLTNQKNDIVNLGILLLFKSGLRPGELAALKKEDIGKNLIRVNRTEIRYYDENGKNVYEVRDFPKTEAGIRNVILPEGSEWILKGIRRENPFGEYLFERNGKRLRTYIFTKRLETICRRLDIKRKSQNKIRKTYGTILIDSKVDESLIISQMGHTDIRTTKGYYYKNRKNEEQKMIAINKVTAL